MKPCAGPDRNPKVPKFKVPANACDCHAHIFGPSRLYPFSPERSYTPEDCTLEEYRSLLSTLGFTRAVIVQGGPHGTDNRVTLNAISRIGGHARGVAVIRPGLSPSQLASMHEAGIRGCRLSTVVRGGAGTEHLEALAAETHALGWHILMHLNKSIELVELEPRLRALETPFVLDHLGRVRGDEGVDSPAFKVLMKLLDTGRCWVKLASLYRLSSKPYPHEDMLEMIRRVVDARPDRIIWGSNWPHPIYPGSMPNDGDLVDLIPLWVPAQEQQYKLLVENPAVLYGFE